MTRLSEENFERERRGELLKRKDIIRIARETLPEHFQSKRTDAEILQVLLDLHDIIHGVDEQIVISAIETLQVSLNVNLRVSDLIVEPYTLYTQTRFNRIVHI
jgi:hypothetical protein